jgi:hypothetical protein
LFLAKRKEKPTRFLQNARTKPHPSSAHGGFSDGMIQARKGQASFDAKMKSTNGNQYE